MMIEELFIQLKNELNSKLSILKDKPEESVDSTLKACWLTAAGMPKSAEEAMNHPLPELSDNQRNTLFYLIEQRLKNVPLAHLTGRQNFMGIEFLSDKRALIPRKETEILGKKALDISIYLVKEKLNARVMDICCGGGNLGLALAFYNKNVHVFSTDISHEAIELTKENSSFLNLNERVYTEQGDIFSAFDKKEYYGTIDIVVCNPPYISSSKALKMNSEISGHEPILAFDGGVFGTKIIQKLIIEAPKFLTPGGWLLFEVGVGQGEFILRLCRENNHYSKVDSLSDPQNNIRVIMAQKKMANNFQNLM